MVGVAPCVGYRHWTMGSLTLLLGRTRVRRRRALRAEQYAGVDALGRPNFLFVTDSARKKQTVQEEFVTYRNGACFLPEVSTLAELQSRLIARYVGGKAPWSESGVALWLVANFEGIAPDWLRAAGPAERVAPAVASAFFAWEGGARAPLPGARGARLSRLFRQLAASLDAHPARVTRYSAVRTLIGCLQSPGEALTVWLRRSGLVVVDDVIDPPPLERELLFALAKAWASVGTNVVISFECGADGVEEEARYFGLEEGLGKLSPTVSATRTLRRACLDALIAEGAAEVFVAGPEFGVHDGPPPEERIDPTDVWGTEAVCEPEGLTLETWPDPAAEVRAIAHGVRRLLDGGASPRDIWVAFPGLPTYAGLVRRAFTEAGVPYALSRGEPLAAQPGARALLSSLRAALAGNEPAPLLAALAALDLPSLPAPSLAAMARRLREKGMRQAPLAQWLPVALGPGGLGGEVLAAELDRLRAVVEATDAPSWQAALGALAEAWGLRTGSPERDTPDRRGAGAALGAADALAAEARASRLALQGAALTTLWLAGLEGATAGSQRQEEGAVAVVGMMELRGIHPKFLYVGGLLAEDFPGTTANDWLFDSACRDALGGVQAMPHARYLLGSAIRNSLSEAGNTLTLSWPRQREGKLVLPSPVVEELLGVHTATGTLREQVASRRVPEGRYGSAQWMREAARTPEAPWLVRLRPDLHDRARGVRARWEGALGPFDGMTDLRHDGAPLAVTAFESYLACPARYMYTSVLKLGSEETFSLDLPPSARGRLLHQVLQRFLRTAMIEDIPSLQAAAPSVRARHRSLLAASARAELDHSRDVSALPAVQRELLEVEWCAGLDDERPSGLLRAWLDEEVAAAPSSVRAVELDLEVAVGPLRLRGRADRVDNFGANAQIVLDHKTGGLPRAQVAAGLKVQGVLYGRAVATEERPQVAGGFASVRRADDVARGAWAGPEALLAELLPARARGLVTDGEVGAALDDWLSKSAERLAAGRFHPTTADAELAGCGYCDFSTVCRVDRRRAAVNLASGSPDVQTPFSVPATGEEEST